MEFFEQADKPSEDDTLRDLFQFCLHTDSLIEKERASTLRNIVHSAFREGIFYTFADVYDGNAWEEFVTSRTSAEKLRIVESSLQYAEYPAYKIAERFIDDMEPKDRKKAYAQLGALAAKAGDVYDLYRYAPKTAEKHHEQLAHTFIAQRRWEELQDLASYGRLEAYTVLGAARATAEADRLDEALAYLKQVVDRNLALRDRSGPDTGSWIDDALVKITQSAFTHDQLTFIAELPTVLDWPDDVKVETLINSGLHAAARNTGNHDAAIMHYVDVALRAGEDAEAYEMLLRALEENNWDAITLLAPQCNSEILTALQAKARAEKNVEVAKELFAVTQQRGNYQGHEIFFADDTSPLIEDLAENGDWEQVLTLVPSAPKIWFDELMYSLAEKAVTQDRTDILPRLMATVDFGPYYLERFLYTLLAAQKLDEADALYAHMCERVNELPEQVRERMQGDLPYIKLHLMKDKALYAVDAGDYIRARLYLEELGDYIPVVAATWDDGFRTDAQAFELVGSMILEKIANNNHD